MTAAAGSGAHRKPEPPRQLAATSWKSRIGLQLGRSKGRQTNKASAGSWGFVASDRQRIGSGRTIGYLGSSGKAMPRSGRRRMPVEDGGSVTRWIGDLKAGDPEAARALWERYFDRLVRLARKRLSRRAGGVEDEEDAALSAFDSFCAGLARGRFTELGDRDDLWKLLVVITARKAAARVDRRRTLKRGGAWNRVDEAHLGSGTGSMAAEGLLAQLVAQEPTPEFAAMVAEETRLLLGRLEDEQLRQIALDRMEGYTTDEIAERLGCARRTVARRLDLIRQIWSDESA